VESNHGIPPIIRIKSGEVVGDALTSSQTSGWAFNGDVIRQVAPSTANQYYNQNEGPDGLLLGVRAVKNGNWSGYYAVTPFQRATIFHAQISLQNRTIPSQYFDAAMWVQTSSPMINTVACGGLVNTTSYYWWVEYAKGNFNSITQFTPVYTVEGGPLTRDCTIVTNGSNLLRVYFDEKEVYSNDSLNLQLRSPFQTYLEVQSSFGQSMIYSSFRDYYATTNGNVTLIGSPPGDRASVVCSNGTAIASSIVGKNGTVNFNVERLPLPINGSVRLYGSNNTLVTSTLNLQSIWGGDVYTAGSPPPTTASLTIQSVNLSGEQVSGFWVQLWNDNGSLVGSGFTPITFSGLLIGYSYSVAVQDYQNSHFVSWDNHSTVRSRSFNLTGDATFVAQYSVG
jgi:hypothetical protein